MTGDAVTDENGRAVFQTTIPKGADPGAGLATVLVRTNGFGSTTSDRHDDHDPQVTRRGP